MENITEPLRDPELQHYIAAGVYIKQLLMTNVGDTAEQHSHKSPHLSLLAYGTVEVEVDGIVTEAVGPTAILVDADKVHKITAVAVPALWYCVHGVDPELQTEEEIIPTLINNEHVLVKVSAIEVAPEPDPVEVPAIEEPVVDSVASGMDVSPTE